MKYLRFIIGCFLFLLLALSGCRTIKYPDFYVYSVPKDLNDGFVPLSLTETGADMTLPEHNFGELYSGAYGEVHSLLAAHGNRIFLEEYYPGKAFFGSYTEFNEDTRHNMASVTKSICSILIGIAVDKGYIENIDDPVLRYYPEYENTDPKKEKVTIRHLLTMSGGFEWDEHTYPYTDLMNDIVMLYRSDDPILFALDRKIVSEPGKEFKYNGGGVNILGDILKRASGLPVDEFAESFLFSPMGIKSPQWVKLAKEKVYTSGDIKLRPRDLLKIGLMFLDGGKWKGEQIVSEEWVRESTKDYYADNNNIFYGFLWWTGVYKFADNTTSSLYAAMGWGGQSLIVIPEKRLLFVTTAGNYKGGNFTPAVWMMIDMLSNLIFSPAEN